MKKKGGDNNSLSLVPVTSRVAGLHMIQSKKADETDDKSLKNEQGYSSSSDVVVVVEVDAARADPSFSKPNF